MKANGIHQSQSGGPVASSIRDTPIPSPRRKTSPSTGPSNKKRKLDNYADTSSNFNADDDEGLGNIKAEAKAEPVEAEPIKAEIVEEEPTGKESLADSTNSVDSSHSPAAYHYPSFGAVGFDGANDGALFDDFLAFGGSLKVDCGSQLVNKGDKSEDGVASNSTIHEDGQGMTSTTRNGNGQGLEDTILIVD